MTRNLALTSICGGILLLIFGLYGAMGAGSIFAFAAGGIVLLFGIAALISTHRPLKLTTPHGYVFLIAAIAGALHGYEFFGGGFGGALWWFTWAMTPYALSLAISSFPATRAPSIAGGLLALALDFLLHYELFVETPKGSTAGLALVFLPFWNNVVFVPVGTLVAWAIVRRRASLNANAP
jgi:hypothetical protein